MYEKLKKCLHKVKTTHDKRHIGRTPFPVEPCCTHIQSKKKRMIFFYAKALFYTSCFTRDIAMFLGKCFYV